MKFVRELQIICNINFCHFFSLIVTSEIGDLSLGQEMNINIIEIQ